MTNWEILIDEKALASVLPAQYAHFARPIRDGLAVFLNGLPGEHQAAILGEQAALPRTATISERLGLLARSCPVLQKLGQVLARDRRLSPDLRQQLRRLESLPPSVPLHTIEETLTRELGAISHLGVRLLPPAIAEASVAVVIPFQQTASSGTPRDGVFKILKPGIEQRLDEELSLLERVGEHLDERCDELNIPHLDYRESFQHVREKLWDEIQLRNEQQHLEQSREFFKHEPRVQIPTLLDHCSARVTAMERIRGRKVTNHRLQCDAKQRSLAKLVARALIARPIFTKDSRALFHGDPHAGNLFFTNDDRLAILDWSLVGELGESDRIAIMQIMLGAVTLDSTRIVMVLEQLSDRDRLDRTALRSVVSRWTRRVRRGQFPGLAWLVGLLDDAVRESRMRVGPDLMLFRKSLHTLEGVVADVGEETGRIDKVLCGEFVRHFAAEWPLRWIYPPDSRGFATRLSNLDLTHTTLSIPSAITRFWTGHTFDMLDAILRRSSAA